MPISLSGAVTAAPAASTTAETASGSFASGTSGSWSAWQSIIASAAAGIVSVTVSIAPDIGGASSGIYDVQLGYGATPTIVCQARAFYDDRTAAGFMWTALQMYCETRVASGTAIKLRAVYDQASAVNLKYALVASEL